MDLKYKITKQSTEVSGMDLTSYRHKKLIFLGSFYVKDLREDRGAMVADYVEGDVPLTRYRDTIHSMHVGWKTPLVELVASFMKVAYLVSRGVIYQPFEEPENFIYNKGKHRVQVVGRHDTTLRYLDEPFLDWVMEMVGFLISSEDSIDFGYLTHQEYYTNMDTEHKDLYQGYLEQKDFQAIVEYTLEPSVIEVLDQFTPLSHIPIDNNPLVREVLAKSIDEKEAYLKEEQEKQEAEQRKVNVEQKQEEDTHQGYMNTGKSEREIRKGLKDKKNRYTNRQRLMKQDKIDKYREDLGIPEDKPLTLRKRRGENVIPTIASLLFLIFAIWLAYTFYMWLI